MSHTSWEAVKLKYGIRAREQFGAQWKVAVGYRIWDNDCGHLLNLEDTYGWSQAVEACNDVSRNYCG